MFYAAIVILGVVLTAIAFRKKKGYLAGVGAFSTATFAIAWPAYHFFSWATLWLLATLAALLWTVSIRNALSRIAFIVCAGVFTVLALGAGSWVFLLVILAAILAGVEGVYRSTITKVLAASAVAAVTLFAAVSGNPVAPTIFGTAVAADADSQDLTIKPGELLPDAAKCGTDDKFNHNSMSDTKDQRGWGNSVSTPFKSTDKDAQFKELVSEICVNPVLGDAYIQALTDAQIGSFSVAQANPWMAEFTEKSKGGLKVWLTHKASDTKGFYVTGTSVGNYQYYAQMTTAVLYVLDNQGTKTATSKVNWPLGDLVADTLPRVHKETNPKKQESLPFMALTFTEKDQDCPYVLGVNVKDKRPENFDCKKAKQIAPPTPTKRKPPTIPPGHPTPSGTPTKPGNSPSPTPSHSTPPKSCPSGQTGTPPNCLEIKDPKPIPSNSNHTPAASHSESAKPPVHPSQTATTGTAGSESTQKAEGSTPKPKPSETAPHAGDPTSTATACVPDPDSGKAC